MKNALGNIILLASGHPQVLAFVPNPLVEAVKKGLLRFTDRQRDFDSEPRQMDVRPIGLPGVIDCSIIFAEGYENPLAYVS